MKYDVIPSCARRVFDIAEALCLAVGNAIRPGFIDGFLALLVVRRIQRVRRVLLALEARFLAGTLVLRGAPVGVRGPVARSGMAAAGGAAMRFPRRFAWLCGLVPGEAACFAGQLRVVLAEPEMVRLFASCPQAVRAVRPLCWMLGIEQSVFVPPADGVAVASVAVLAAPVAVEIADVPVGPGLHQVMTGQAWMHFIRG